MAHMSTMSNGEAVPRVTLGWRLRMAMEQGDLEAKEMADLLGVHRGTITRWTHDIGKPPRPIYLERWADVCQVSYVWLVGGDTSQAQGGVTGHESLALAS